MQRQLYRTPRTTGWTSILGFLGVVFASLFWSAPVCGQVLLRETISREVSVFVGVASEPTYDEAFSREVSVLVTTEATPAQVSALSVSTTPIGDEATLSWTGYPEPPQHDLTRYDIYVSYSPFTDVTGMTPYTTVPVGTFSVVLEGLPPWQDRYFAVVAVDALGGFNPVVQWRAAYVLARETISREMSVFVGVASEPTYDEAFSREASVLVTTEAPPAQVTTLSVSTTPIGDEATLSWTGYPEPPQHDLSRYVIYVSNHAFTDVTGMTPYTSVPVGTFSVVLEGLPPWQDRYFAVVAVDALGGFNPVVQWRAAYVLARETISREMSVFVGVEKELAHGEAISREVSVFVGVSPEPTYNEAFSREVSVLVPTAAVPDPVTYPGSPFSAETSLHEYSAIDLNWTHYPEVQQHDVMRYRIYIGFGFFNTVAGMTPVAYVPVGTRTFTLRGLHGYGVYHVAVVAEDMLGQFNPSVFSRSALASGRLFSLRDYTSDYVISFAMDYRLEEESFNLRIWAYDLSLGELVSDGFASYQVTQGGWVLATGMLNYSPTHREWRAQRSFLAAPGRLDVQVLINGRSDARWLIVPSPFPVHLTGRAQQDDGTPIVGGMVRLYAAETVFSALDLMNLPEPLATFTTLSDGSFDFGELTPGQYVLTLETDSGMTFGRAFWLRGGTSAHHEILIENPGRTALLIDVAGLRDQIGKSILEKQTEWMRDVTSTVDRDLDGTKDLLDWAILAGNVVSGMAKEAVKEGAAIGAEELALIAVRVSAEEVALDIAPDVYVDLSWEIKRYIEAQSIAGKATVCEPYFAFTDDQMHERELFLAGLAADYDHIIDPIMTGSIPIPSFSRNAPVHRDLLRNWFPGSRSYQFAETWLEQYYQDVFAELPALPSHYSIPRAQRILAASEAQLRSLEAGTANLFVSPWPDEVTGADGSAVEPLGLNLADHYDKYTTGRAMAEVADFVNKGSGLVSIGLKSATVASAAGVVTLPVAKVTGVAALVADGIGLGASVWRGTVQKDLTGTYYGMGMKYLVNLGLAPLALKRTADYFLSEAGDPLYYFDERKSFEGEIRSVSLGGADVLGHEVFFPVQLTYLPFIPPIQFTPVIMAQIDVGNPTGMDYAEYRVDARVRTWQGTHEQVHDHVVVSAGGLDAGETRRVEVPFRGHLRANTLMSPGVFETRLWVGPFQLTRPAANPFMVLPMNLGFPPLPGPLVTHEDAHVRASMSEPLSFVQSDRRSVTAEDLLAGADRVRDRVDLLLRTGAHTFSRQYVFDTDVFSAQFRLYRPAGSSARMRVETEDGHIAWDDATDSVHMGLPGKYSGRDGDPETITVHNVAAQAVTVRVALSSLDSQGASVLLEVWEQPLRDAVMAVLPGAIHSISRPGTIHVVELAIGESSHQHPLESVNFTASPLCSASGTVLNWHALSWAGETNIAAGGLKTCSMELDTHGVADGTYTGAVTVSSARAGTVEVPVSITIDGQAPTVTILPVREWWHRATGPVVSWIGQDNVTDEENLLFSKRVTPVDGSWSGYHLVNSRDMTDLPDGEYLLSVAARDQALNITDPAASVFVRIDREGSQFLQRIVDADPDITDVSQVNWHDDWDGDGVSNWQELLAGTDPTDPNDLFAFRALDPVDDGFDIRWKAKRGVTYQVRRTTDLVKVPWTDAPSGPGGDEKSLVTAPADGELVYRDTSVTGGAMFYKIEVRD